MVNTDHEHDINPLADYMTQLQHFTKEDNCDFSAFRFSFQLILEQTITNLIVCLMISQKLHTKVAQTN